MLFIFEVAQNGCAAKIELSALVPESSPRLFLGSGGRLKRFEALVQEFLPRMPQNPEIRRGLKTHSSVHHPSGGRSDFSPGRAASLSVDAKYAVAK
jgi:hypothetical protein